MTDILFGVVIPALVFVFSYVMTHLLYKHFAREVGKDPDDKPEPRGRQG